MVCLRANNVDNLSFTSVLRPAHCGLPSCFVNGGWRTRCGFDSSFGLTLRLRDPFGPLSFSLPSPSTTSTRSQQDAQQKLLNRPALNSERWQFLMLLPNQLIRDIAFVATSPSTFYDSDELPIVSKDMFGEDSSWKVVADWLKSLDPQEVLQYFEGRRYTTRLGDHFAACIEYVLKFSPLVSPEPLFISQQVEGWSIQNQCSFRTPKKGKGAFGSFPLGKGGMMSEVVVELIENDVLIKRFSSYQMNDEGRIKELSDSDIERLMVDFKRSTFDHHASTENQELVLPEEYHEESTMELEHTNAVHESILVLPDLLGVDVFSRGVHKWRINYPADSKHEDTMMGNKTPGLTSMVWRRSSAKESKLEPKNRVLQNSKSTNHALSDRASLNELKTRKPTTEADGETHVSKSYKNTTRRRTLHQSTSKPTTEADGETHVSKSYKNTTRRRTLHQSTSKYVKTAQPARRLWKAVYMDKGGTAGECDFLFKANAKQSMQGSSDYAWTHVHHWEVSVHFLLYIGPWEVFGLVTPGSSAWHHGGKRILSAAEGLDPISIELAWSTFHHFLDTSVGTNQMLVLDACYVALSIGDTWLDRKKSMSSKLKLSRHPNTAAKVSNLFHSSLLGSKSNNYRSLRGSQLQRYDKYRDDPSIIRVIPRALTKGYLFYEPQLWLSLCMQRGQGAYSMRLKQTKRVDMHIPKILSASHLNVDHWIGWWVYASDFAEFACSYGHKGSMWYIAPRSEWLSPIIIDSFEMHRCRRVFDIVGMLTMILKVGEEAAALQPPRATRFMVAEVCWDPDISTATDSLPNSKYKARERNHGHLESSKERGRWVEVSRGFLVENTWPESREQLAHGFAISWSPALIGWS